MGKANINEELRERVMKGEYTPSVTRRFFKVTDGPLIDEVRRLDAERRAAFAAALEVGKQYGADEVVTYCYRWLLHFQEEPNSSDWKRETSHGGRAYYKPIRRTKVGRQAAAALKRVGQPTSIREAVKVLDIPTMPSVIEGNRWYTPGLRGWLDDPLFIVSVPWRAYDPEILEAYKAMRDAGEYGSGAMDWALWTPHESMQEIQEWEALKIGADREAAKAKEDA